MLKILTFGWVLAPLMAGAVAPLLARDAEPKPKSVTIVNLPSERRDYGCPVGNVRVRFKDGHSEMWTSGGRCLMPKISKSGLVGWTRFEMRNDYGDTLNGIVRIRFLNGRVKDFAATHPFIEAWGFADGDRAVVIQSMRRHGPSYYIKYDIATGETLGEVDHSTLYEDLPEWAKPYSRPGE